MTPERRPRQRRQAPELGDMMRRMLRALVRRATDGDLFALEELRRLQGETDRALAQAARGAHDGEAGYSYTDIGRELGMTRQGARELAGSAAGGIVGVRLDDGGRQ